MASRNDLAGERIVRFASLRYKMDSSRQTLQRISDAESLCSRPSENGKGVKRPFIRKRLVIGNGEYVRVGKGNQLVRDPKERTRVLANEKVRWSLQNARLRLAKKKKYCQFFTRFEKCNKDDGKCPYVHDPSKIAVCTKFLNGLCPNENCRLTHKVIPERMPDCSYFLQGLCNNEACPYRHVHVNPNAAVCDGFLRGYCSDGDEQIKLTKTIRSIRESDPSLAIYYFSLSIRSQTLDEDCGLSLHNGQCQKKYSYTCLVFEATGSCSQGPKCKLHHPKSQSEGRKRKKPSEPSQKNAFGRYFGSPDSKIIGMEGLDIIDLDTTGYEASDNNDLGTEQFISGNSEAPVSIYNLIRPVALMQ